MYDNDDITGAFGLCTCIRSALGKEGLHSRGSRRGLMIT